MGVLPKDYLGPGNGGPPPPPFGPPHLVRGAPHHPPPSLHHPGHFSVDPSGSVSKLNVVCTKIWAFLGFSEKLIDLQRGRTLTYELEVSHRTVPFRSFAVLCVLEAQERRICEEGNFLDFPVPNVITEAIKAPLRNVISAPITRCHKTSILMNLHAANLFIEEEFHP